MSLVSNIACGLKLPLCLSFAICPPLAILELLYVWTCVCVGLSVSNVEVIDSVFGFCSGSFYNSLYHTWPSVSEFRTLTEHLLAIMTKRKSPLSHFLSLPSTSRLFLVLFLFLVFLVVPLTAPSETRRLLSLAYPLLLWQARKSAFHCLLLALILVGFRVRFTLLRFIKCAFWNQVAAGNFSFSGPVSSSRYHSCSRHSLLPGASFANNSSDNVRLNCFLFELFYLMTCTGVTASLHPVSWGPIPPLHLEHATCCSVFSAGEGGSPRPGWCLVPALVRHLICPPDTSEERLFLQGYLGT